MQNLFPAEPPSADGLRVRRKLGEGGTAQVWLVSSARGEEYALKCFAAAGDSEHSGWSTGQHPGLRRELRVLKNFRHRHLIALHDVVKLTAEWAGMTGLLMDYAPAGSLAELLGVRTRLSVGETITILTPIFQVLDYLHTNGVQHGDISAGNVLFSAHGQPLLADLGLAAWRGEKPDSRLEGTEGFFDPARHQGTSRTAAADIYALSVLGWWCLSGEPPSTSRRLASLPQNVPQALIATLRSGMATEPAQRPEAATMAREIFASATALPVDLIAAVHPSVLPQLMTRRRVRRGKWPQPGLAEDKQNKASVGRSSVPRRTLLRQVGLAVTAAMLIFVLGFGLSHGVVQSSGSVTARSPRAEQSLLRQPAAKIETVAPTNTAEAVDSRFGERQPAELLAALCQLRAEAFRGAKLKLLEKVDAPASTALTHDQQSIKLLLQQRHLLSGFSISVTLLSHRTNAVGQLVLSAWVHYGPYAERSISGSLVSEHPKEQRQKLRFILVKHQGRWLISQVFAG